MLKLPKDDPPTFKNPAKFSKEFTEFVTACLQKDPAKRPSARNLLTVSFLLTKTNPI
jgi:serine/threonine protein kinase